MSSIFFQEKSHKTLNILELRRTYFKSLIIMLTLLVTYVYIYSVDDNSYLYVRLHVTQLDFGSKY